MQEHPFKKKNRIRSIGVFYTLYGLLLLDSGSYFVARGGAFIVVQLFLAAMLLAICGGKISTRTLCVAGLLTGIVVISAVGNAEPLRDTLVTISEIVIALLIANSIINDPSLVSQSWRRLILFLSIFSLIVFIMTLFPNGVLRRFPILDKTSNLPAYFVGFSFAYAPRPFFIARNLGLFWEPGAYQTYLVFALICEMFFYPEKKLINQIILTITLITTLSTTGIVCGLIIWTIYSFVQENKAFGLFLIISCVAIVLSLVINMELLPTYIRFSFFTKLRAVFYGDEGNIITANTRIESFSYGLDLFLQSPIIGIGRGMRELKELMGNGIASCTPVNWLAQYGVFVGCIIYYGFFLATRNLSKSALQRVLLLLIVILSLSTEAFNYSPTILFIVFVGFHNGLFPIVDNKQNENTIPDGLLVPQENC